MPSNDNHLSAEQFEALLVCLESRASHTVWKEIAKRALREIFEENTRLRENATKDPMTGYANFQGLVEASEQERSRIEREQSKGFVLVALDLDGFKQINDTYGHAAGDAVIIEFANRLGKRLRAVDTLCRKSGDEFWVLAANTTIEEFGPIFDQTLLEVTQDSMTYEKSNIPLRASHGYGEYDNTLSFEGIMKIADQNMYICKEGKKNRPTPAATNQASLPFPAP